MHRNISYIKEARGGFICQPAWLNRKQNLPRPLSIYITKPPLGLSTCPVKKLASGVAKK